MTSEHKPDAGKIADAMLAKSREHLMGSDANFERVHAVMANLTVRAQSFVSVECVVEVLAAIERLSPQPVAFVNSYELAKLLPDDENAAPDRTPGIQRTQSRFRNVPLYAGPQPAAPECSLDNCLVPNKCQRAPDCAFGVTAAPAQSGEPVKIHKLWAHGGCTGINDYLMTDFSIRTLKVSEIKRGQTFPDNDGSHETVSRDNPYAASLAALKPSPTAVVLDGELLLAAKEILANGHQHDVGGGDVFISTCDSAERLERAVQAVAPNFDLSPAKWTYAWWKQREKFELSSEFVLRASKDADAPVVMGNVLDDERAALLADYVELNMSNYGPDDVDKLNAWGIEAYGYLARAASAEPVAQPVVLNDERAAFEAGVLCVSDKTADEARDLAMQYFSCVDAARAASTQATAKCCEGGPQWGHAWGCKTLP